MTHNELVFHPLIIPSVVIPFTALLALLSAGATFAAGLIGVQLKAEGPKKLLELLLKPRVLLGALVFQLAVIGAIKGYFYFKNTPAALWRIEKKNQELARPSALVYTDTGSQAKSLAPTRTVTSGKVDVVWSKQLDAGSFRGAAISGDSAFIGVDSGWIYELDLASGETRRRFFIGTAVSASPVVYANSLYIGEGVHDTHHARIYKFDLKTGKLTHTFETTGHIEAETIVGFSGPTASVLVPSGAGGLWALDAQTLQPRWHAMDGHIDSAVTIADGRVFVGTGLEKENFGAYKGGAHAYDLASGKRLWYRELPSSSWMPPVIWKDKVCFIFGEVYFASDLGGVYCFAQSDGQPDIAYNNAAPIVANPTLIEDDVITSDFKGKVCRVSLQTGRALWCRETGETKAAFTHAVLDPFTGLLVYPSRNEGLYVLEPATGRVVARWQGDDGSANGKKWQSTFAPPAIVKDGWIVVDMKGVVRKLRWTNAAPVAVTSAGDVAGPNRKRNQ